MVTCHAGSFLCFLNVRNCGSPAEDTLLQAHETLGTLLKWQLTIVHCLSFQMLSVFRLKAQCSTSQSLLPCLLWAKDHASMPSLLIHLCRPDLQIQGLELRKARLIPRQSVGFRVHLLMQASSSLSTLDSGHWISYTVCIPFLGPSRLLFHLKNPSVGHCLPVLSSPCRSLVLVLLGTLPLPSALHPMPLFHSFKLLFHFQKFPCFFILCLTRISTPCYAGLHLPHSMPLLQRIMPDSE